MYEDYITSYLKDVGEIASKIDHEIVNKMMSILANVREKEGRLFIIGIGGGAGHASHAVNDFRKLTGIETYTPVDNVSELTARTNDDGWHTIFSNWLIGSHINKNDAVLVFSVGGGDLEKNISPNIVEGLKLAKEKNARILGVVGRDGGYTKQVADACVVIPTVRPDTITPHTEEFQAIIWHLIVSHPKFQMQKGKWESVSGK